MTNDINGERSCTVMTKDRKRGRCCIRSNTEPAYLQYLTLRLWTTCWTRWSR